MNHPRYELVHTAKGWHLRFRAENAAIVVDGEPLPSRADAVTAMCSVASAHSPVGMAEYHPAAGQLRVHTTVGGHSFASVQVIERDERRLRRGPNPLAQALRRRRR